ncbi:MAG: hypothetical protein ACQEP8_06380, partial [Chlamydiota bacterium]
KLHTDSEFLKNFNPNQILKAYQSKEFKNLATHLLKLMNAESKITPETKSKFSSLNQAEAAFQLLTRIGMSIGTLEKEAKKHQQGLPKNDQYHAFKATAQQILDLSISDYGNVFPRAANLYQNLIEAFTPTS